MAKIEIVSAFVEEQVGSPVFVLKCAEPHSRKDEQGNWQTVSRTFFDVKVSRESGIQLEFFPKGSRIQIWGNQKTEVREHEGKKFYSLVVWADRIEPAQQSQGGAGASSNAGSGDWAQPPANQPPASVQDFQDEGSVSLSSRKLPISSLAKCGAFRLPEGPGCYWPLGVHDHRSRLGSRSSETTVIRFHQRRTDPTA